MVSIMHLGPPAGIKYMHKCTNGSTIIEKKNGSLHIQRGIASGAVKHSPITAKGDHMSIVGRFYSKKFKKRYPHYMDNKPLKIIYDNM